jgi:DNA-binding MarR family transcriptional regulator
MTNPSSPAATSAALLAQDLRALMRKLKRQLREQSLTHDLAPSQVSVLLRLEKDGPATASALARAEGMRPQSMAPILPVLEHAGLVERAADPNDGRKTLFSMTDACRHWLEEARAARQDWLTRTLQARLTSAELDRVADAVVLLQRLVE